MLTIHEEINKKLDIFIEKNRVPHIIFHGPYGSGKKTIVRNFLKKIYNDDEDKMKDYVMYVDCAQGKGIKFVREDIKFFAKTNIKNDLFKSIVFLNTDKLTMDAQSALRRCIELFSHSTRFFIILEDKYKLLKPISSRFCEFYVGLPKIKSKTIQIICSHRISTIENTDKLLYLEDGKLIRFGKTKSMLNDKRIKTFFNKT